MLAAAMALGHVQRHAQALHPHAIDIDAASIPQVLGIGQEVVSR